MLLHINSIREGFSRARKRKGCFTWQISRWISWLRCAKTAAIFSPAPKFTAAWPIPGISAPWAWNSKTTSRRAWWQKFVQESPYNTGLDCAILMNREVWVASGHVGGFNDPLMDCKACKARFRADKLIEDFTERPGDRRRLDQRGAGSLHRRARHRLPRVRQEGFHRHPPVQPDVQDPSRA